MVAKKLFSFTESCEDDCGRGPLKDLYRGALFCSYTTKFSLNELEDNVKCLAKNALSASGR
jgi:hypothetical protein